MQISLNSRQKHALAKLFACQEYLEQSVEGADKHMPKPVLSELKHARTRAKKAWDLYIHSVDAKSAKGVVNLVKDFEIVVMNKRAVGDGVKEFEDMMSGKEYVYRMAEVAMSAKCQTCDGKCRDECPLYESFVHFDVPVYDENHTECPYSQLGVGA